MQFSLNPSRNFDHPVADVHTWGGSETNSSRHHEGQHLQSGWTQDLYRMSGPSTTPGNSDFIDPSLQADWVRLTTVVAVATRGTNNVSMPVSVGHSDPERERRHDTDTVEQLLSAPRLEWWRF